MKNEKYLGFKVKYSGKYGFNETSVLDINNEEVFIETNDQGVGEVGDKMEIILTSDNDELEIAIYAELIKYGYHNGDKDTVGAGFKFLMVEPEQERMLHNSVSEHLIYSKKRRVVGNFSSDDSDHPFNSTAKPHFTGTFLL